MPRMLEIQIDADIFVRGMSAGIGIAQPGSGNRQLQFVHEGIIRPTAAHHRDQFHFRFENFLSCIHHQLDEWVIRIGFGCWSPTQKFDLDIGKAFSIQMLSQQFQAFIDSLAKRQAEIDFG